MENKSEPAENLKKYSVEELQVALKYQRDNQSWTFFDEREFMENLMCQRFNFLLVFYSIFVAAAASTTSQRLLVAVLITGAIVTAAVWGMIWRAFVKFDIAITICYRLEHSAVSIIDQEARLRHDKLFRVNPLIAKWIPFICLLSLVLGAAFAAKGWLTS